MNKPQQTTNTLNKPIPVDELFNTEALAGAVIVCAIGGSKTPPWQGD